MDYIFEGESEEDAIKCAVQKLGLKEGHFDVEILPSASKKTVKVSIHTQDAQDEAKEKESPTNLKDIKLEDGSTEEQVVAFIEHTVSLMGYKVICQDAVYDDGKLRLNFSVVPSEDASILIGARGKNIDALELVARSFCSTLAHPEIRVVLDIEDYRARRDEEVVKEAQVAIKKVRATHESVLLPPMNPYERRLVHMECSALSDIYSESEGEGIERRVRIKVKDNDYLA